MQSCCSETKAIQGSHRICQASLEHVLAFQTRNARSDSCSSEGKCPKKEDLNEFNTRREPEAYTKDSQILTQQRGFLEQDCCHRKELSKTGTSISSSFESLYDKHPYAALPPYAVIVGANCASDASHDLLRFLAYLAVQTCPDPLFHMHKTKISIAGLAQTFRFNESILTKPLAA